MTMTQKALDPSPSQSMEPIPKTFRAELTRPFCGAISNIFWNRSATATVGRTTGKKTRVRMRLEPRLRANT